MHSALYHSTHTHTHAHTHARTHARVRTHARTHTHTIYIYKSVLSLYVCVCIYIYIHTHARTHTHRARGPTHSHMLVAPGEKVGTVRRGVQEGLGGRRSSEEGEGGGWRLTSHSCRTICERTNSKHWFKTSFLQPLPHLVTSQSPENCQLMKRVFFLLVLKQ